jgi:hypothetical protein
MTADDFRRITLGFPETEEKVHMGKMILILATCVAFGSSARGTAARQSSGTKSPEAAQPKQDSHARMNERGAVGMGFSQTATTHHFILKRNGGAIQVETNDSADAAGKKEIRMHLAHIAQAFQSGDFNIPMFVHDTVPPGVPEMKRLKKEIQYSFVATPNGGRVTIATSDKEALAAIHKFLRFQIEEHRTGDPTVLH